MKAAYRYQIYMLIVTLFWGMSYVFTKLALEEVGVFATITLRFLIAFLLTFPLLYSKMKPIEKEEWKYSFYLSILLFCVFISMTFGVKYTTISNAGFLVSISVVFIPFISWILNGEKPQKQIFLLLPVVLFGILLLTVHEAMEFHLGDILCILCSILYGFYVVFTGKFVKKAKPITLGVLQFLYIGIFSAAIQYFQEDFSFPASYSFWISILCLSLLCTAFGYIMQAISQQEVHSYAIGFILCLEPVFSAMFGYVLLGELLSIQQCLGSLLLLGSVLWISLKL